MHNAITESQAYLTIVTKWGLIHLWKKLFQFNKIKVNMCTCKLWILELFFFCTSTEIFRLKAFSLFYQNLEYTVNTGFWTGIELNTTFNIAPVHFKLLVLNFFWNHSWLKWRKKWEFYCTMTMCLFNYFFYSFYKPQVKFTIKKKNIEKIQNHSQVCKLSLKATLHKTYANGVYNISLCEDSACVY